MKIYVFCTILIKYKGKKIFKKEYLIYFIIGLFSSIIAFLIILVILKHANIKGEFDHVALLSVNVGILQGLIGIIGIGVAIAAYFNFTQIREKLKEIDKKLIEHDEKIKKYKISNKKDIIIEKKEVD